VAGRLTCGIEESPDVVAFALRPGVVELAE
jgi:hypothetical protein